MERTASRWRRLQPPVEAEPFRRQTISAPGRRARRLHRLFTQGNTLGPASRATPFGPRLATCVVGRYGGNRKARVSGADCDPATLINLSLYRRTSPPGSGVNNNEPVAEHESLVPLIPQRSLADLASWPDRRAPPDHACDAPRSCAVARTGCETPRRCRSHSSAILTPPRR